MLDRNKNKLRRVLTNQEILNKIIDLLKATNSGDTLVVFFSCHGGGEGNEQKFIFDCTSKTNLSSCFFAKRC
jgi:hypothetical protein